MQQHGQGVVGFFIHISEVVGFDSFEVRGKRAALHCGHCKAALRRKASGAVGSSTANPPAYRYTGPSAAFTKLSCSAAWLAIEAWAPEALACRQT